MSIEKRRKKWWLIPVISGGVIALVIGSCSIISSLNKQPTINEEYWNKVKTGGDIEAKYTKLGEYEINKKVIKLDDEQVVDYVIVYPKELETTTNKYPMVLFVNGSNDPTEIHYNALWHLASHGFIVVGNEDRGSGTGKTTSDMLDYMLNQNNDSSSFLYNKIDIDNIGITGGSQGACGAIRTATIYENSHYYKTIVTLSLPRTEMADNMADWSYDVSKLNIPLFMTAGTGFADSNNINPICPLSSMEETYNNLPDGVSCAIARRKKADHTDMMVVSDGYLTAWFSYYLKGDIEAGKAFIGDGAELLDNEVWQDVKIKNIK